MDLNTLIERLDVILLNEETITQCEREYIMELLYAKLKEEYGL